MKLILVNPPCLDARMSDEDSGSVPMGLYSIGAVLLDRGNRVILINLARHPEPMTFLKETLEKESPDILGFSVLNATRFGAMEGAALARRLDPSITIVFGGAGATFLARHLFLVCPEVDYIVLGEGETTILDLVDHIASASGEKPVHIPGLAFRHGKSVVQTPDRKPIDDLDSLPQAARYFGFQHVSLTRGCPGRCTFCGSPDFWGRTQVRSHSPEWFVGQLELLAGQGITHFYFSDDTFTMDRDRVMAVSRLILDRGLAITWAAISRVDFIDREMLVWMRRAGCVQISFGVESGSEAIRKVLGKPVKTRRIIKAFQETVSVGILPRAYFIYGSPGETRATIQESIDLMLAIRPLGAVFYLLVVFPGTDLYRKLEAAGRVDDSLWTQPLEDLPWFEVDDALDFNRVQEFGNSLRQGFFQNVGAFARSIELLDDPELFASHADFLSRLAMTFSHGDYGTNPAIPGAEAVAGELFSRALSYAPDARAYLGIAMLHQKEKQFRQAADQAALGLSRFPGSRNLVICMAVSLMNLGQFREAQKALEPLGSAPDIAPYLDACQRALG
ncbi:MAG: radical SAM protein [Pseudomonadota bacterium]